MKAPTFVPISPVTVVAPSLEKAPALENNAKPEADPRLGACPERICGIRKNKKTNGLSDISSNFIILLLLKL